MQNLALLIGFILFPFLTFGAETIYTWGYGDILGHILESITALFQTDDFAGLFKIFLTVGIVLVLLSYLGNRTQDPFFLIKFYAFTMLIWYLTLAPSVVRTTVYIEDLQNPSYSRTVTDVPYVIAKVLSWFSKFEKVVADKMETVFSVPDDLKYSNTGFLTAFGTMANANSHKIVDPYLYLSVNNYIEDCVFPDILDGSKDVQTLAKSNDLWTDLGNTNPARTTKYYNNSNPDGTILDCQTAYSNITSDLNNYINTTGFQTLSNIIGGFSSTVINNILGTASDYYLNYSVTGQGYLQQAVAMNMFSEAFQNFAKVNGISTSGLALGVAKAEETARYNMVLSGVLGAKYIPIIKGILTVLIVGLIPILTLLLVTPMFKRVLIGFLMIFGWLSLWHIGEVLINAIINVKASGYISTLADGNYNLLIKGAVDSTVLDYINTVASFYWAIPTIAFLIASGFSVYAMNSLAGQASGKMQGATGGTAGEMATGSINTSSNVSTGRRWSFDSFAQIGNSMALAYTGSLAFGSTETVNQKFDGVGTTSALKMDGGQIAGLNSSLQGIMKGAGLDLNGTEKITGSYTQQGSVFSFDNAKMGRYTVSGKYNTNTQSGNLTFIDSLTGKTYQTTIADGKISQMKISGSGASGEIRTNKDGSKYFSLETANGVSVSGIIDKDGQMHIQKTNLPDKLQGIDVWKELNEEIKGLSNIINGSSSIAEAYRKGNAEQQLELLDYMLKVASSDKFKGSKDYKIMQDTSAKALQETVRQLSEGGDKLVEKAHKIDKERAWEFTLGGKGYMEIGLSNPGVLQSLTGVKAQAGLRAEIGGKNAWISKDGMIVQDKDGNYWKLDFSKKGQEVFAKNFQEALSTNLTKSGEYSTDKSSDYRETNQSSVFSEGFKNQVAQLVNQDAYKLDQIQRYAKESGINLNQDLTRFMVESIAQRENRPLEEVVNDLVNNPSKIRDYLENDDIRNDILQRAYGEYTEGKEITFDNANKTQHSATYYDLAKDIMENANNTDISKLQERIENAYKTGVISEDEYNQLSGLLNKQKQNFEDIPKVKPQDFNEQDAINKANEKGINSQIANKYFDTGLQQQVQQYINSFMNNVGFDNHLKGIQDYLINKYGEDIQSGINTAWSKLNYETRKLVNNEEFMEKIGLDPKNIKPEDIQTGKALQMMDNAITGKLHSIEEQIEQKEAMIKGMTDALAGKGPRLDDTTRQAYLTALNNETKQLEQLYQEKRQMETYKQNVDALIKQRNEIAEDVNKYRSLQLVNEKMDGIMFGTKVKDDGIFMANPQKVVNYPHDSHFGISPEYKVPNRGSDYDDKPNYIGGTVGLSTERVMNAFKQSWNNPSLKDLVVENLANNPEVTKIRNKYLGSFDGHSAFGDEVVRNLSKNPNMPLNKLQNKFNEIEDKFTKEKQGNNPNNKFSKR